MVNSGNPSKDRVTIRSCYSLHEAKLSSEYLAADNFHWRDFPATSIPAKKHTIWSASLRSTFRWKPRRKITSHTLTCADLQSGVKIHSPARGGACDTVFTRASSSRCVCRRQAHPSTPRIPLWPKKPFFFTFSLRPLLLRFSVALISFVFCVFWSSTTFSGPWELFLLIPTDLSYLWLKKTSLCLKKVRLLILLYLELL